MYYFHLVPETPIRMLIKRYPDLAEMVFNNCITKTSDNAGQSAHTKTDFVCMDYEFIDDGFFIQAPDKDSKDNFFTYCSINEEDKCIMFKHQYSRNAKVVMDNHPLMIMAKEEQRVRRNISICRVAFWRVFFLHFQNLLKHPICLALIRRKWQNYGRYLYFAGLFFYLVYLFFITYYAILTTKFDTTDIDSTTFPYCTDSTTAHISNTKENQPFLKICQYGIVIIVVFEILLEIVQFYRVCN